MPRSEEENQRIREAQRARILEAAKVVVAKKGWGTTMADIANEAKVSQGLAYRYFDSKESIFRELMRQLLSAGPFRLQEIIESEETPTRRMEALITAILKNGHESIENFQIFVHSANEKSPFDDKFESVHKMFHELRWHSDDPGAKSLRDIMANRFRAMSEALEKLIVEGQESGEFADDDPAKLTLMLLSCIRNLTGLAMRHPEEFKKHYPYTDIIMRMLKPNLKSGTKEE